MNSEMNDPTNYTFQVAISNPGAASATVTLTQGATTMATATVAPGAAQVVVLPWNVLRSSTGTQLLADGAYRLRSTQPVTVVQYNPYQYGGGYSADSSLLLPVQAWGTRYVVAARASWLSGTYQYPGFYSVVAANDGTQVTLQPSLSGGSVQAGGGVPATGAATVTLNRGGVLQVAAAFNASADVTGT